MNVLALNTAFKKANVALVGKNFAHAKTYPAEARHSENLLLGVDAVMERENMEISSLDAIACVVGPGSFTGLRIAVATAKGMMVAYPSIKAIALSSLELLAFSKIQKDEKTGEVLAIMNGLSDCFFVAVYSRKKGMVLPPKMVEKEELATLIKKHKVFACSQDDATFFGIEGEDISDDIFTSFVASKLDEKNLITENELVPVYLRLSQAEQDAIKKETKND